MLARVFERFTQAARQVVWCRPKSRLAAWVTPAHESG
jgi:hypothetical protein